MAAYLKINGTNILPYLVDGGFSWSDNDLDSDKAGRTLDGQMWRGKVTSKLKYELECRTLKIEEAQTVINLLTDEFVTVETNIDPKFGTVTRTMYNSSRAASIKAIYNSKDSTWDGIKFNLIER